MAGSMIGLSVFLVVIIIAGFALGSFFALPMIWYHAGAISRKLSRIIELLEKETRKQAGVH